MLPVELANLIGKKGDASPREVHRSDIRRFADAVGDTNPLYWDDDFVKSSRFKGVISPPDFFGWPANWTPGNPNPSVEGLFDEFLADIAKLGYTRVLNGGVETEYILPVRPGDTIKVSLRIANVEQKEGKRGGKMLISTLEVTFTNQNGQVVAKQRLFGIH